VNTNRRNTFAVLCVYLLAMEKNKQLTLNMTSAINNNLEFSYLIQ